MAHTDSYKLLPKAPTRPTAVDFSDLLKKTWEWFGKLQEQFCMSEPDEDLEAHQDMYWGKLLKCIQEGMHKKSSNSVRQFLCDPDSAIVKSNNTVRPLH